MDPDQVAGWDRFVKDSMENLMVIQVEVIAPENPLDANTSSKKIAYVDSTICKRPKISSVLIFTSCDIQKYFMLI
jgi:hypothetical protein